MIQIWILQLIIQESQGFIKLLIKEDQVRDNKVKVKRKENRQKKDELQTIEKNLKKILITCLQLMAKVNKEATQEVDQDLKINISSQWDQCQISNNSNTCLSSSIQLISTHLLKDNNKTLVKMVFHLVIMDFKVSKLHKFISLLKSSNLLHRFHQINSWTETRDHLLLKISIISQPMLRELEVSMLTLCQRQRVAEMEIMVII